MSGKMVYLSAEILDEIGCRDGFAKDVDDALRLRLNLPARSWGEKSRKTKSVKPRAELLKIEPGTTMTYPRSSFKYESILNNVYRHNRSVHKFAIWSDDVNTYVMRFKK